MQREFRLYPNSSGWSICSDQQECNEKLVKAMPASFVSRDFSYTVKVLEQALQLW